MTDTKETKSDPVEVMARVLATWARGDEDAVEHDRACIRSALAAAGAAGLVMVPLATIIPFASWLTFVEASRELDGDPPLSDDRQVLHFVGNGASATITVGHFRAMIEAASLTEKDKT